MSEKIRSLECSSCHNKFWATDSYKAKKSLCGNCDDNEVPDDFSEEFDYEESQPEDR